MKVQSCCKHTENRFSYNTAKIRVRVFAYSIKIKFECRETILHPEQLCKSLSILSTKGLLINK